MIVNVYMNERSIIENDYNGGRMMKGINPKSIMKAINCMKWQILLPICQILQDVFVLQPTLEQDEELVDLKNNNDNSSKENAEVLFAFRSSTRSGTKGERFRVKKLLEYPLHWLRPVLPIRWTCLLRKQSKLNYKNDIVIPIV